jgi:hypothetical protein
LREAMRAVREGREPQNLIRDPAQNQALETSCQNTVMTAEQFGQMTQTMPSEAVRRPDPPLFATFSAISNKTPQGPSSGFAMRAA